MYVHMKEKCMYVHMHMQRNVCSYAYAKKCMFIYMMICSYKKENKKRKKGEEEERKKRRNK